MIKNTNRKITTNSQLSKLNLKKEEKEKKQTTRTRTESQKWRSHGWFSVGEGKGMNRREWCMQ